MGDKKLSIIRLVRKQRLILSSEVEAMGISRSYIHSLPIRVYSPAKTLADCFKFGRKINPELAFAALNEALCQKKTSWNMLLEAAELCKIRPLLLTHMKASKDHRSLQYSGSLAYAAFKS